MAFYFQNVSEYFSATSATNQHTNKNIFPMTMQSKSVKRRKTPSETSHLLALISRGWEHFDHSDSAGKHHQNFPTWEKQPWKLFKLSLNCFLTFKRITNNNKNEHHIYDKIEINYLKSHNVEILGRQIKIHTWISVLHESFV